jgi:hypothetical protein
MNFFDRIRERIGSAIAVVIGSVALLGCGLFFTLFLAPQQKLEARRIERLPLVAAAAIEQSAPGDELLFTGHLQGNSPARIGENFVAYLLEEWRVTAPEYDPEEPDQEPQGDWVTVETLVPDLQIEISGGLVTTLKSDAATLSGPLQEVFYIGESNLTAQYEDQQLADGSQRLRGFYDGDLITILAKKATVSGVIPTELFAGDRVAFVESKHAVAKGLLIAGIAMIGCSPVVLIGGGVAALFGRRRK